MKSGNRKKLVELLLQVIPVMIGVYLGFVVSNWSDSRTKRHDSKVLIENINLEIKSNQKKLTEVVDYHQMLLDSCRYYSKPGKELDHPKFFNGTKMMTLTNSAYVTGLQTGIINELKIEQIQALNQLYTYQEFYNDFGKMIMSGFMNKDFSKSKTNMEQVIFFLSMTMTDVVIQEQNLIEQYGSMLTLLSE